jgi:putative tryptophan/tyrosine transport system substrate-binding protein
VRRREFIAGIAGAVTYPLLARAQKAAPVIGFLHHESRSATDGLVRAFLQGLSQSGFVAGRDVSVEYRFADGHPDRLSAMALDLARRQVSVIIALASIPAASAAKAATETIPILIHTTGDPVALGLVTSLSRPGGNVTGVTSLITEIGPKRIKLLHKLLPAAKDLAFLNNPSSIISEEQTKDALAAAHSLGLTLHPLQARSEGDIEAAFNRLQGLRAAGLVIGPNVFFYSHGEQLASLALRNATPVISPYREVTAAGALMSYGTDIGDHCRIVGAYAGRILRGERPADLPVQQATKIDFVINLKAAKAIGLTVPETLLATADEVIQ